MFSLFIREKVRRGLRIIQAQADSESALHRRSLLGLSIRRGDRWVVATQISMRTVLDGLTGPYGANIFDPRSWGNGDDVTTNTITLEFTRVVLAIGVFAIGVELPKAYMARHWKSLFFLLAPIMTWVCLGFRLSPILASLAQHVR